MRNHSIFTFLIILALLIISLACSLVQAPSIPSTPTASIYATALTTGGTHACALLNNGKMMCWGSNSYNQLGLSDKNYKNHTSATLVSDLTDVTAISAGGEHTCALFKSSTLKCWGNNISGQLGDGTKITRFTPVDVKGLTGQVIAISAGDEHTCAIITNGGVKCWGKNLYGRVGNDSYTRIIATPSDVTNLTSGIKAVSAGLEHTCAITNKNILKCWGSNDGGELGIGTDSKVMSKVPVNVIDLTEVIAMSAGFHKTCAVTSSGAVKCWGWSGLEEFNNTPTDVTGVTDNIIAVATGTQHSCALTNNGLVKCWGLNEEGQLGNGNNQDSRSAVDVKGLPVAATAISANNNYTCALLSNGEVWCWGENTSGQLGNGTTENSAVPVKVIGITQ